MRKLFKRLLLTGVVALPLAACELQPGEVLGDAETSTGNDDTFEPDPDTNVEPDDGPVENQATAIRIEDQWNNECRSLSNSNGADIDAVGIFINNEEYYLDFIVGDVGDGVGKPILQATCNNNYTDINQAKGAPDSTKLVPDANTEFVSLHGGYIAGSFETQPVIMVGDTITVYEVGANVGGQDNEQYDLYVMLDPSCDPADNDGCAVLVGDGAGQTEFDVEAVPF